MYKDWTELRVLHLGIVRMMDNLGSCQIDDYGAEIISNMKLPNLRALLMGNLQH